MNINYITAADEINENALFADSETVASPFMTYENESLHICHNDTPISMYICDTDKKIVMLINKYRILTSMQIIIALNKFWQIDANDVYVKNRLKLLVRADYVQISEISCDDGRVCSTRFYSIGYRGRGLMKTLGALRVSSYIAQIAETPETVKRVVSCNQFLIRYGIPFEAVESGQVVAAQPKTEIKGDLVFRTTAMVNGDSTIFVESVRTCEGWLDRLDNKLGRMKKVLKKRDISLDIHDPKLIIVCESVAQMKQVLEYLAVKRLPFETCCTCDPLTYQSPENCLYSIKHKRTIFGLPVRAA